MNPGRPADLPQLAALQVQAEAHVTAWLDKDYWTISRIMHELAVSGATAEQVAEVYSLAAAALLTDAFRGQRSAAAVLASRRLEQDATRQARVLAGLDADAA